MKKKSDINKKKNSWEGGWGEGGPDSRKEAPGEIGRAE